MRFTLRCVQCMVTSVFRDQQYMFGVQSLLVVEKALLITNDVIIKKFLCIFKIKFPTKRIFWIFPVLRINGMAPFCNLVIERRSYLLVMFDVSVTATAVCRCMLSLKHSHPYSKHSPCYLWNTHTHTASTHLVHPIFYLVECCICQLSKPSDLV